jgi:hypothetical protein
MTTDAGVIPDELPKKATVEGLIDHLVQEAAHDGDGLKGVAPGDIVGAYQAGISYALDGIKALLPSPSLGRADLVEREAAARVAETEPEFPGEMPASVLAMSHEDLARAACRATKKAIATRIRALPSTAAPVGGWRPIDENTPRDGTVVDLWVNGVRCPDCWFGALPEIAIFDPGWCYGSRENTQRWQFSPFAEITHWMPLPASPNQPSAGQSQDGER